MLETRAEPHAPTQTREEDTRSSPYSELFGERIHFDFVVPRFSNLARVTSERVPLLFLL